MEIKKRITAITKRLTPQIEASNTGVELANLATRFEELLNYAEEKEVRREESVRLGKPRSVRQLEKAQAAERNRADVQDRQQAESLADQAESQKPKVKVEAKAKSVAG